MLKFGNKEFRNLQEQVEKNMDDIRFIIEEEGVLNQFGLKIIAEESPSGVAPQNPEGGDLWIKSAPSGLSVYVYDADDADWSSDIDTYKKYYTDWEYGDTIAVMVSRDPVKHYLLTLTRKNSGHADDYWFNIGQFPLAGPKGDKGDTGEQGETGLIALECKGLYYNFEPTVGSEYNLSITNYFNRTPIVGDNFIASYRSALSGKEYLVDFSVTNIIGGTAVCKVTVVSNDLHGAQGAQGADGQDGAQGPQGPKGDKGDRGDAGGFISVRGILDSEDDLPDPATLRNLTIAYLVGQNEDLYIQVGESSETALWTNTGPLNAGTLVYVNGSAQNTWDSDVKLDKVTEHGANAKVYTVSKLGTQTMTTLSDSGTATAGTIPVYTLNGALIVARTLNDNHAASKKYVDDAISGIDAGVTSVNSKTGAVTLTASDINASNSQSIQTNLERLDERIDDYAEDNIEGSDTIVFDLNEQGDKYQISIDQDVLDTINGKLNATKSAVSTVGGLVVPSATPTEDLLVGIDTTNGQQNITIGSGLTLANGELSATGASSAWGSITGTITNQTDLVSYVSTAISTAIGDAIGGNY